MNILESPAQTFFIPEAGAKLFRMEYYSVVALR